MLRLDILMKIGNIPFIDNFLLKNKGKRLKKLKKNEIENFITWYLSQEYSSETEYKEAVFFYIDEAARKVSSDDIEELAIDSRFLSTKPEDDINYFLRIAGHLDLPNLNNMEVLKTYLTSRISDNASLADLMNLGIALDYEYAFSKLVDCRNIDSLIKYDKIFFRVLNRKKLAMKIIESRFYSLDEIKKFLLETGLCHDAGLMVELFGDIYKKVVDVNEKDRALDIFISLIIDNQNKLNNDILRDSRTGDYISGYEDFAYQISISIKISMEMKNKLAEKLLNSKNYDFIYEWFVFDVECDYNYNLIDALMLEKEEVIVNTLSSIDGKYVEYAIIKLINRGRDFVFEVMGLVARKVRYFEIEKVDSFLDVIYNRYYDFKLSKEAIINLVLAGSKYTSKYLSEFEFDSEERSKILEAYKWDKVFLVVYEPYLKSGDKTKLMSRKKQKLC